MLSRLIELVFVSLYLLARRAVRAVYSRRSPTLPEAPSSMALGETIPALPGEASREIRLDPQERRRHLYVLGATGCGKTNFLLRLIESDIQEGRSFCVIDLRGDLVDRVLLRLAACEMPKLAERVLLIDLRHSDRIVPFNPLSGPEDPCSRAMHVLGVIRSQVDSWGVQLEETLRNCLVALAESGWSLTEVEPLLTSHLFRRQVLSKVSDPAVRRFFARYGELSPERQSAWLLPVLNKLSPLLAIPRLRLMLSARQGISYAPLLDERPGQIILVALAADQFHGAAQVVGGLLVSGFQAAIMARVRLPEAERIPVHLYIDEFETMATERFEEIVAEGRRFGVGLCLSHQNLSQLPQRLRQVLRNNVYAQALFQTGAVDAAELASEIPGEGSKEEVRDALMSQGVGEAFLVRRGQDTVRAAFHHSPDPKVSPAALKTFVGQVLDRHARRRTDLEQELAERERLWQAGSDSTPASEASAPSEGGGPAPRFEVRERTEVREGKEGKTNARGTRSGKKKPQPASSGEAPGAGRGDPL